LLRAGFCSGRVFIIYYCLLIVNSAVGEKLAIFFGNQLKKPQGPALMTGPCGFFRTTCRNHKIPA